MSLASIWTAPIPAASGVRLVDAHDDIHQSRLARTVFAEQGMDLALGYGQIDIVVRIEVTESFADVFHAQQFFQLNHAPLYSLSGSF